jgi:hypothetical protein
MHKADEAELAWRAWELLGDLQQLLWDRYEREFMDFLCQEQAPRLTPRPVNPEDPSP